MDSGCLRATFHSNAGEAGEVDPQEVPAKLSPGECEEYKLGKGRIV